MPDAVISVTLDAPKVDVQLVVDALSHVRTALTEIERQLLGSAHATWGWQKGPMELRAQANGVPEEALSDIKHAFYRGVEAAAQGRPDLWPDEVPTVARDAILRLTIAARTLTQMIISANDEPDPIVLGPNAEIMEALHEPRKAPAVTAYDIVDGKLDLISVRKALRFSIDDLNSRSKVVCYFSPERLEEVKLALGRRVVAEGDVTFDAKGRPRSISNITSFWTRDQPIPISGYIGRIPGLIGTEDPTGHVRRIRRQGIERT